MFNLKLFETESEYSEYMGEEPIFPNVSYVTEDKVVHYNPQLITTFVFKNLYVNEFNYLWNVVRTDCASLVEGGLLINIETGSLREIDITQRSWWNYISSIKLESNGIISDISEVYFDDDCGCVRLYDYNGRRFTLYTDGYINHDIPK